MRRWMMIVAALALFGCEQPTATEPEASVQDAPVSAPEEPAIDPVQDEPTGPQEEPMSDPIEVTEEPTEPTWQPDPMTVYILDSADEIYLSEVCTEANYASRLRAYQLSVELYNRDEKTGHPFTAVGGGLE